MKKQEHIRDSTSISVALINQANFDVFRLQYEHMVSAMRAKGFDPPPWARVSMTIEWDQDTQEK